MSSSIFVFSLSIMIACISWCQANRQVLSNGSEEHFEMTTILPSQPKNIPLRTSKVLEDSGADPSNTRQSGGFNSGGSSKTGGSSSSKNPNPESQPSRSNSLSSSDSLNWRNPSSQSGSISSGSNQAWRDIPSRSNSLSSSDSLNWRDPSSRSGSISSGSGQSLKDHPSRSGSISQKDYEQWKKFCSMSSSRNEHMCESPNWRDTPPNSWSDKPGRRPSWMDNSNQLILAQSWPAGNILHLRSGIRETTSLSGTSSSTKWTIHGLWPKRVEIRDPSNEVSEAVKHMVVDLPEAIRLLRNELMQYWPSYDERFTNAEFWEYEYRKHGIEGLRFESINTAYKYFKKAIDLVIDYNMGMVFERLGVLPGALVNSSELRARIKELLGVDVIIVCDMDDVFGEQYIYEVRLCFDTNLQLIDCWGSNACDDTEDVIYPREEMNERGGYIRRMGFTESAFCMDRDECSLCTTEFDEFLGRDILSSIAAESRFLS